MDPWPDPASIPEHRYQQVVDIDVAASQRQTLFDAKPGIQQQTHERMKAPFVESSGLHRE
jgi:hypothetical protein